MKAKVSGPADTPKSVRTALWVNLVLAIIAIATPRMASSPDTAALLFAVPMALIVVVGAAVVVQSFILARREDRPLRWTAFLPIAVFLVGVVGTVVLVQTDAAWEKPPVEIQSGKK